MAEKIKCDCGVTFEAEKRQTHCRYCGIKLSDIGKKKPVEKKKSKGCLIAIGLLVGFFILIAAISGGGEKEKPTPTPVSVEEKEEQERRLEEQEKQQAEEQKKQVEELAATFCEERQGEYVYDYWICGSCVDLDTVIDMFEVEGPPRISNAQKPPTRESCKKIAELCLQRWGKGDCTKIAERKIWLGMTLHQLVISWGIPKDKNDSVGVWGVHSQWVYDDFGPYVYLEGKTTSDLVVTSWQD